MPMPIAHACTGAILVAALRRRDGWPGRPLLAGALLANSPDLDFLLVWALHSRGWHRSFTHAPFFALLVGLLIVTLLGKARWKEGLAYGMAYASHGLLDFATTSAVGGVELLWPASTERYKLGLFGLSEHPSRMSLVQLLEAGLWELLIFVPLLSAVMCVSRGGAKGPKPG